MRKRTSGTKLAEARIQERMSDNSLTWPWEDEVKESLSHGQTYVDGMRELLHKSGLEGWQKDSRVVVLLDYLESNCVTAFHAAKGEKRGLLLGRWQDRRSQ